MRWDLLEKHVEKRKIQLAEIKKGGTKVVGYLPGNFVPEEIIYAAGAVPLCLCEASWEKAQVGLSKVPNVLCPFARAQIGQPTGKKEPLYAELDAIVVPITCQHLKKVAEVLEYEGATRVIKLGVPHQRGDLERSYFAERLRDLSVRLEHLTGKRVTRAALKDTIEMYNRMRALLRQISYLRCKNALLDSLDFARLNHLSFYSDPLFFIRELEKILDGLAQGKGTEPSAKPRLLLLGPNLSSGDYMLLELIQASGGMVVAEEFFEGMRYCSSQVASGDDPFEDLATYYLLKRPPPAFMRSATRERLEFVRNMVSEFAANGVIWYQLLSCETYDQECYIVSKELTEKGIPFLMVESDYSKSTQAQLRTRIEAFLELLRAGQSEGIS